MASAIVKSEVPNTSSDSPNLSVSLFSGPSSVQTHDSISSSPPSEFTNETPPDSRDGKKDGILVIPDLFSSIMAVEPVVNPNYFKVKPKGDAWIQWYFNLYWPMTALRPSEANKLYH